MTGNKLLNRWLGLPDVQAGDPEYSDSLIMLGLDDSALTALAKRVAQNARHDAGLGVPDLVEQHMLRTQVKLGQPDWTGDREDLGHLWRQPEMERFWIEWHGLRGPNARGPRANDACAKATMALLGMTSETHAEAAHARLRKDLSLQDVFDTPAQPFEMRGYSTVCERFEVLSSPQAVDAMMRTNAAMFRALCELYPDEGFGDTLLMDGTLVAAWVDQKGDRTVSDATREALYAQSPDAGPRFIGYGRKGKRNLQPGEVVNADILSSGKFVRGYYYVAIVDQASNWPLVSVVQNAAVDEAPALVLLLQLLAKYFPFISPKYIVGDGAWDEDWAHRLCEVFYGIVPVFRATNRAELKSERPLEPGQHQTQRIKSFDHRGRLRCMEHNQQLDYQRLDRPSRRELRPGQAGRNDKEASERENQFRLRVVDRHGAGPAGEATLQAKLSWRRFGGLVRYPEGRPSDFALRQALMMRLRSQAEGYFNRVKSGVSLATAGADRVRLRDMPKVEALLHLAELRFNALSLADVRLQAGVGSPPSLPVPRPVANQFAASTGATSGVSRAASTSARPPRAAAAGRNRAAARQVKQQRAASACATGWPTWVVRFSVAAG